MQVFYILLVLTSVATIYGLIEFHRHQKRIYSIPIRIHINGTRGKSSVTRLVGAGLREGGVSTITKVTGTFPRLILEDGKETHIYRKADANILEQLSIVKYAADRNVQALVMECMALQPQYQTITETQMIHSNLSVMTNIRMDHVDVMGHTLDEIAETLGRTIPKDELLFTSEDIILDKVNAMASKKKTEVNYISPEIISREEMKSFKYIEHRENVSLALAICLHLNIDRETAMRGMYKAVPDAGALRCFHVRAFSKQIFFYNAFAANDPDSTFMIWQKIKMEIGFEGKPIILLNTRHDRLDRAKQLAEMVGKRLNNEIEHLILIGQSTEVVEGMSIGYGLPKERIVNLGYTSPDKVFDQVLSLTDISSSILAIGNMGGMGAETADFFEHRSTTKQ